MSASVNQNFHQQGERNAALDFLRGVAGYIVATSHFVLWQGEDYLLVEQIAIIGVEIFFVLSGYVLAPQILLCFHSANFRKTYAIFMSRRWLRTVPPYLVALVAISLVAIGVSSGDLTLYAFYIQNLFFIGVDNDYYGVAWSLSVEEWFYLLFPVFMVSISRVFKLRPATIVVLFIVLISVSRAIFADATSNFGDGARRIVAFRLDSIAYGVLLYMFYQRLAVVSYAVWAAVVSGSLGLTLYFTGDYFSDVSGLRWLYFYTVPLFSIALIMLCVQSNDFIFEKPWIKGFSIFIGRMSYPVYLFHLVVIIVMSNQGMDMATVTAFSVFIIAVTAFSYVFNVYFEQPILRMRPSYSGKRKNVEAQ